MFPGTPLKRELSCCLDVGEGEKVEVPELTGWVKDILPGKAKPCCASKGIHTPLPIVWHVFRPNAGQYPAPSSWDVHSTGHLHSPHLLTLQSLFLSSSSFCWTSTQVLWICFVDVSTYFAHTAKIRVFHWGQYLLSCSYWSQNMGPHARLERRASPLEKRKLFSLLWDPALISSPGWLNSLHMGHLV